MTEQEYCQFALSIQDASNLSGLVISWAEVLREAKFFTGTTQRNTHPATRLILHKLADLSNLPPDNIGDEYGYCIKNTNF